jgi:multidrug efflux pump subunit AcrA (membrane-fusion protein)
MTLESRIDRLETALSRLAEAVATLAAAQVRTEARLERLEEAVATLAAAQARTEVTMQETQRALQELSRQVGGLSETLQATQRALQQLARQVGGLSETVGGDIEDIAYIVLHEVLGREFGWKVGVLERTWQPWEGEAEEVDVFGRATDPARPAQIIWIVGEAKHNLTLREVERFARQVERARRHLRGEVYAVCFAYRARPEVRTHLQELGIPLVFSYGRFAGGTTG